ncbi:hypothetical protein ACE6H2_008023 [Prunus campanulata]
MEPLRYGHRMQNVQSNPRSPSSQKFLSLLLKDSMYDLHSLCLDLLGTLSQEPESRRQAEASLSEASQYPNYTLVLLSIVAQPVYDEKIRQAASFNFINQLKVTLSKN